MGGPSGVLLVGHGTRDATGTAEFFHLSDRLAEQLASDTVVRPCLLEFQQPTISEAWQSLMRCGVRRVTVAPLLLFSAGHAKGDIPGEVAAAQAVTAASETVPVSYARPISRQAAMIGIVRDRLRETLQNSADTMGAGGRTAIVMVGRGSRDVCASADMQLLSEVAVRGYDAQTQRSLAREFGISSRGLFTTFYAMAEPCLTDTLDAVATSGQFDRIVVQPHLLFAGRLYDAISAQTHRVAVANAAVRFEVSAYLGPSAGVASAIAARIREAQ